MATMKTPGVYIVEKNAFPNSVVEVATAVPAFIGFTEKADNKGLSLHKRPWRITSLAEFHDYFGGAPTDEHVRFSLKRVDAPAPAPGGAAPAPADAGAAPAAPVDAPAAPPSLDSVGALSARDVDLLKVAGQKYALKQEGNPYLLYYAMRLFFQNGGGPCYVVSVGSFGEDAVSAEALLGALVELEKELEPTMVVVPDAMLLKQADSISVQQAVLAHCGLTMKNRFAILDVWEGYRSRKDPNGDCVALFRNSLGINQLEFGAAYYPWVQTTVVSERDLSFLNLADDSRKVLVEAITAELAPLKGPDPAHPDPKYTGQIAEVVKVGEGDDADGMLRKTLPVISGFYRTLVGEMARRLNLLPPSAAMAGLYTMVDNTRGVWKAPANVSLNSVTAPAVPISNAEQEDLNVTPQGKSINALRSFIGEGTLVWGARTLDGNSLDWRYINVRRTMIMLEESVRLAAKALVFEPNVSTTWITIKAMIANFLTSVWKRGGLAGAVPEDAFSVHVGLGETMTPEDILEGIMRVTVLVAISRPAEFIEITFQQQMQKS